MEKLSEQNVRNKLDMVRWMITKKEEAFDGHRGRNV